MAINMQPSQLDSLFAADTPITPDPPVRTAGAPSARGWIVRGNVSRDEMIQRLVAAGHTPAEAAKMVDGELNRSGGRPRAMFDQDNTPEGNEALRQRVVSLRDKERRQGIFEDDYNAATGAPSRSDMAPPPMDPDQVPLTAQQLREMGYNPYTEPGVNMPDGSKAEGPQQLMNEREAAAYNVRTPNGPGWYNPSGRDKAMMARGYVPVMAPDGTVSYRLGPGGEVDGLPGAPGRGGRREDLESPLMKADGTPVLDGNGNPVPRFRVENRSGPLSENNSVYVQSNEARAKQAAYMKERQLYRDAEIQGVSPAALLAQSPGLAETLTAGGQRDRVAARAANEGARQAAADKREEAWRAQMMLSGGRPTGGIGGSKATVNAWLNLPEDQRDSAMRYMLPGGQLSATVDANNAAQAGRMAQAAMTAFLNNNPTAGQLNPLQQQQLDQMQSQLPAAEQVPIHKDKPGVHPSELKYADDYVSTHYSRGGGAFGISSGFTLAEQQSAIDHLVNDMGYAPAKAQKIVDEIARRRNAGSWMGSPVNPATGAAPAGAAAPGSPAPPSRGDL